MPLCTKAFLALSLSVLSLNVPLTAQSTAKCGFQTLNIEGPAGSTTLPLELSDTGAIVGFLRQGTGAKRRPNGCALGDDFRTFSVPEVILELRGERILQKKVALRAEETNDHAERIRNERNIADL